MPIRASDTSVWSQCRRRAWFDQQPQLEPYEPDAFEWLIQDAGEAHELAVKAQLEAYWGPAEEATSIDHTRELMAARAPLIYQPVLTAKEVPIIGKPDFLILSQPDSYQVADAKLATSLKGHSEIGIQLALYRRLFVSSQPALVYLGNGEVTEVADEFDAKADEFLRSMLALLQLPERPPARYGHAKCSACPYQLTCVEEFEDEGELSLLYGLDSRAVDGLNEQGIATISGLADSSPEQLADVPYLKGENKKQRAIWQARAYQDNKFYLIEPIELPRGTWVHFDVEANPLSAITNEVYLWGFLKPEYRQSEYEAVWSEGIDAEALHETEAYYSAKANPDLKAWLDFLNTVERYRQEYPDLVLAHYSGYEVTQIKSYAERYDMQRDPRVRWLLGEESPLFDLLPVVKRCLALPLKSYSLKAVCKSPTLVNFQWQLAESGSQWSVVRYLDYQVETEPDIRAEIKQEILTYNLDDVRATRALQCWLQRIAAGPVVSTQVLNEH